MKDTNDDTKLSRRQLLAILGSGTAVAAGGAYLATRPDEEAEREGPERVAPAAAENIQTHGAVPNPNDPDSESAETNLNAIIAAAEAAGDGGTVYVPPGTYYFGHGGDGPDQFVLFGEREPPGVSIIGAGPEESTLAISAHTPRESENQSGFVWTENYDHGSVQVGNIRLDGNYENLPNLTAEDGGSIGLSFKGRGNSYLQNVHFRGWYMNAVRGRHLLRSVQWCTFEDSGIGRHNDSGGRSAAHHVSVRPRNGTECRIENCHFIDCTGYALNVNDNDGVVKMHNCYAEGTGSALCKLSAGRLVEFRHIYHQANTDAIEQKVIDRESDAQSFHGLNFINSLGERGNVSVNLETYHVLSRNITSYALQSRGSIGDGPASLTWRGDMIALHDTNLDRDKSAIRNRNGGVYDDIDIDRLSVHNGGPEAVFSLQDSDGRIQTFHRGENDPLGETSQVSINEDIRGGEPFQPVVPMRKDVGINSIPAVW